MKKILLYLLLAALAWNLFPSAALASNTTLANYYGIVRITNNASSTQTVVSTVFNLTTQELVDGNYIWSNATNTAIITNAGGDTAYMPAQGSTNAWVVYVSSILPVGVLDYQLYLGGVQDMAAKLRYFPDSTGMIVMDNATIELGNNFTITQKGYFNTGVAGNLTYKQDAFQTYVSTPGEITSTIFGSPTWTSPTGNVDPGGVWSNEANAYDENTATNATVTVPLGYSNYLELTHAAIDTSIVRFWVTRQDAQIDTVDVDVYYSAAWHNVYNANGPWGAWVEASLGGRYSVTAMRIRMSATVAAWEGRINEVDFGLDVSVTAAGVSSGEHTVVTYADTVNLGITVDGGAATTVALGGASVPDNANNWTFAESATMPYMESTAISINGTSTALWEWENATTFTDSVSGITATPSFRTATSDADVTAALISFTPYSPAKASNWSVSTVGTMIGAPTTPPGLYSELGFTNLPGAPAANDILDTAGVPRAMFWFPMSFLIICIVGLVIGKYSLMAQTIVMTVLIFLAAGAILAPWLGIIFAIDALAVLIASKQYGW